MPDQADLERQLRSLAEHLDRDSRPTDADDAMARTRGARAPSRRPLVVAVAAATVVALAIGFVAVDEPDQGTEVSTERPAPTAPPTTTSTTAEAPVFTGTAFDDLPGHGIAVTGADGTELLAFDGSSLGRAPVDLSPALGDFPRRIVVVRFPNSEVEVTEADLTETPEGCEEADGAGGLRVALCGPGGRFETSLVAVGADGSQDQLVDEPPGREDGHWQWALPSPDGSRVLAQWDSGCQAAGAYVLDADGGDLRAVGGDQVYADAVGWAPDGRMVIHLGPGPCSSDLEAPGIYLVDPETGDRELLRSDPDGRLTVGLWEPQGNANELELISYRALRELGLEGCCGEASHGGSGLASGAVWNGEDIAITADTYFDDPPRLGVDGATTSPAEVAGAPVVVGIAGGNPFVAFTCGQRVWRVGLGLQFQPASEAGVRDLAEALIPRLYCTVGPRPQA